MKHKSKWYLAEFFSIVFVMLGIVGKYVVEIDPFFHYHKPDIEKYFYSLDNQRSQNDGISKRFDYNMLITGTSMTENFKTTEVEEIWEKEGVKAIKVPYFGASYKEINDNVREALEHNDDLHIVIRGLDISMFMNDKDSMRFDLEYYPTYLYDENIWNDVEYLFNRDVVFDRVYGMLSNNESEPGITSFDDYSYWSSMNVYGVDTVLEAHNEILSVKMGNPIHLTNQEREQTLENIRQNVTTIAKLYPDVTFYYFFPPYSVAYWGANWIPDGSIYRQIEAERLVIEEILKYDNIKLFSFNNQTNITTDLNNYKDIAHYGDWINSLMLRWMHDGKYQLTLGNYEAYLKEELEFYSSYDYGSMAGQEDYENDYYAAALLDEEMYGVAPLALNDIIQKQGKLKSARFVREPNQDMACVECKGCLSREPEDERPLAEYLMENEYIGYRIRIEDISDYRYLVFYGRKVSGDGQPSVFLYDENNQVVAECTADCQDLDNEWHQYLIDVADLEGCVTVIFNGGYTENTGSAYTEYLFSNVVLY